MIAPPTANNLITRQLRPQGQITETAPPQAAYDQQTSYYISLVDHTLADPDSFWHGVIAHIEERVGERITGTKLLDLACGEGHLSRRLQRWQPRVTFGIDISSELLAHARHRAAQAGIDIRYHQDDARVLASIKSGSMDTVVSNLALMDIPDHQQVFGAVRRVMRRGGTFIFSVLHPCFEAPFEEPHAPQFQVENGVRTAYTIRDYAREGQWFSGGDGVRGRVGAYHRTLSTLINDLHDARLQVTHLHEPLAPAHPLFSRVPRTLILETQAT